MKERLQAVLSKPRKNTSPFDLAAFLTALVWLALIPSTTQVLTENPTFFQAHGSSPLFVALILLAALVLGLLLLWLVLRAIKRLASPRGYDRASSIITWLLALAVIAIVAARLIGGIDPTTVTWLLAIIVIALPVSVLLALLIRQVSMGKVLLTIAGVVGLFPLVLLQIQGSTSESGVTVTTANDAPAPPVLLVIADELSYGTVQDEQGNVRPQYPNLKSLQLQSTTYTEAYATANATHLSVPSMLIGLADAREMPNLPGALQTSGGPFTWLTPRYQTAIISPVISEQDQAAGIAMLPTSGSSSSDLSPLESVQVLVADLGAVIGQTNLPTPLNSAVPTIDDRWFDFWNLVPIESTPTELPQLVEVLTNPEQPGIALWHTMITHTPYQRDFDGNWWENADMGLTGLGLATSNLEPMHRQMYAASAREFDRQLGNLLNELKAAGTYDQTLVIVTADHGRTFGTFSPWRVGDTRDQRWGEVAHVPLFVKQPGQQTPNYVSAPRTLAQVGATISASTGVSVEIPFTPAPSLDREPTTTPTFWFDKRTGEAGFEELEPYTWPDAWQPGFLDPTTPESPFADPRVAALLSQPLPSNYTVINSQEVTPDPGPAGVQPVVIQVPAASCGNPDEPGLVTSNGQVIGSLAWGLSEDESTLTGWSLPPVSETATLEFACQT